MILEFPYEILNDREILKKYKKFRERTEEVLTEKMLKDVKGLSTHCEVFEDCNIPSDLEWHL